MIVLGRTDDPVETTAVASSSANRERV